MQMKRREPGRRRAAPPTLLCFPHEHLASTGVFPAMRGRRVREERRAARATQHRRLAFRRRRDRRLRELEGGTGCGRQADRPGWR